MMVTVSVSVPPFPSDTVRVNVTVSPDASTSGAVNVGAGPVRVIVGVLSLSHEYDRESLSGSVEPLPSRVTVTPSFTVWVLPASAVGGRLAATLSTMMVTVSVSVPPFPSDTVRVNVTVSPDASTSGAVNVGAGPVRVIVGVLSLSHEYDRESLSGSVEPLPSRVTVTPSFTVWVLPASAVGGRLAATLSTMMVTVSVSVPPFPSDTVRVNVTVSPDASTSGAVNVGAGPVRVIVGVLSLSHEYDRESLSGSVEPLPSRVTVTPSFTVWVLPASAVGGRLAATLSTMMVTVSVSVPPFPSDTVRVNVTVSPDASTSGAVNVGAGPVRVIVGVLSLSHEYDRESLSGSVEPLPSRVTVTPSFTVWVLPASAVGGRLAATLSTMMVTVSVSVPPFPSDTVRVNVTVSPDASTSGAVNVGGRAGQGDRRGAVAFPRV